MIIAEIGANFVGDIQLARTLIYEAKNNGADLAKLQLYDVGNLQRTPETLKILKQGQLSYEEAKSLFDYGAEIGIEVFFSTFKTDRVKWCEKIGVKRYKITARETNKEMLDLIKETKKPVLASIAPQYPRETHWADEFYDIDFLYCISKYPTPFDSLRLVHVDFDLEYKGFSDHTIGLDAAKIALARGAQIIEKHFAIDHKTGVDAPWSMTPSELSELKRFESICQQVL